MSDTLKTCPYCGTLHPNLCDKIKEIEYYSSGKVKRVVFKTAHDYVQPVAHPFTSYPFQPAQPKWTPGGGYPTLPDIWCGTAVSVTADTITLNAPEVSMQCVN